MFLQIGDAILDQDFFSLLVNVIISNAELIISKNILSLFN